MARLKKFWRQCNHAPNSRDPRGTRATIKMQDTIISDPSAPDYDQACLATAPRSLPRPIYLWLHDEDDEEVHVRAYVLCTYARSDSILTTRSLREALVALRVVRRSTATSFYAWQPVHAPNCVRIDLVAVTHYHFHSPLLFILDLLLDMQISHAPSLRMSTQLLNHDRLNSACDRLIYQDIKLRVPPVINSTGKMFWHKIQGQTRLYTTNHPKKGEQHWARVFSMQADPVSDTLLVCSTDSTSAHACV